MDDETRISGNVIDGALRISKLNAVVEADKEIIGRVNGELMTDRKLKAENLKEGVTDGDNASNVGTVILEEHPEMDYVDSNMHYGPEVTKPKSTWVQLRREVHGLSEKGSKQPLLVLGKRSNTEPENRDSHTSSEALNGKRSKTEANDNDEDQISARVVSHPYRKQ